MEPFKDFFELATSAARAQAAQLVAPPIAHTIRVTRLGPDEAAHITRHWNMLANDNYNPNINKWRDTPYIVGQIQTLARDNISFGLWQSDNLIATNIINPKDWSFSEALAVFHIAGTPNRHPLQGHILKLAHAVNLQMAQQRGDNKIIYMGAFSEGSVKQFEQGAIPLTTRERNLMWQGESVQVSVNDVVTPDARHVPATAEIPLSIHSEYRALYARMFGRSYQP